MFRCSASNIKQSKQSNKTELCSWTKKVYEHTHMTTINIFVSECFCDGLCFRSVRSLASLTSSSTNPWAPPSLPPSSLPATPAQNPAEIENNWRHEKKTWYFMRRGREKRVCVYPCSRAVGNSNFLDHSEVPRSRCWYFVVTRSQQAPVITILS